MFFVRYLFVLLLFTLTNVGAQQHTLDSLYKVYRSYREKDTIRLNMMAELGVMYQHVNTDSMQTIGKLLIKESREMGYSKGIADGYKILGIAYYILENKPKALHNDSLALYHYRSSNNPKGEASVYNNMAVLFNSTDDYLAANFYYKKSLELREKINDLKGMGDCHANIANNYLNTANYHDALFHVLKSVELRKLTGNETSIANSYMILSNTYHHLGNFDKAEEYSRLSLGLSIKSGNIIEIAYRHNNLGGMHFMKQRYDSALHYFELAYSEIEDTDDIGSKIMYLSNIAEVYLSKKNPGKALGIYNNALSLATNDYIAEAPLLHYCIGDVYAAQKNKAMAISHYRLGFDIADDINNKKDIETGARKLSDAYEKAKDLANALKYLKIASAYKDSLLDENSFRKIKDLQYSFEMTRKEQQISLLEKSNEAQLHKNGLQRLGIFLLIVIVISASGIVLMLLRNRARESKGKALLQKQADELNRLNKLKDKTFSILAHDLRSPVASVAGMFDLLEQNMITTEQFLSLKSNMAQQVASLNMLLDNLLNWSQIQMRGRIQTTTSLINVNQLADRNIRLFANLAAEKDINLVNLIDKDATLSADSDQLDLIIRNILSNAIKFTSAGGSVVFSFISNNNRSIIEVKDSGTGMDENMLRNLFTTEVLSNEGTAGEKGTGLGLSLVKEFTENNNGRLLIESAVGSGTTIKLVFDN